MRIASLVAVCATLAAAPAAATPRKDEKVATGDPNRIVCRTEPLLGTRLRSQKRCMTAQE